MRSTVVCCLIIVAVHSVLTASAASLGLYAPDRYDGIPEMCLVPMDFGYCRAKVKRYYFDMRRMKCAMFYFGGCAGNGNNFKSLEECNKVCLDGYGGYDYDGPREVIASSSRDRSSAINKNNNSDSSDSNSNSNSTIANRSEGVNNGHKSSYSKYSNNFNSNQNANSYNRISNNASSAAIQKRNDDNVDEYDYEEN